MHNVKGKTELSAVMKGAWMSWQKQGRVCPGTVMSKHPPANQAAITKGIQVWEKPLGHWKFLPRQARKHQPISIFISGYVLSLGDRVWVQIWATQEPAGQERRVNAEVLFWSRRQ